MALGMLFKGIDKLASKGKINFKLVEEAKKSGIFPKEILESVKGDKTQTLKELNKNCLDIFKDRIGTVLIIALYVPILALSNKIFPVVADWLVKNNDND